MQESNVATYTSTNLKIVVAFSFQKGTWNYLHTAFRERSREWNGKGGLPGWQLKGRVSLGSLTFKSITRHWSVPQPGGLAPPPGLSPGLLCSYLF